MNGSTSQRQLIVGAADFRRRKEAVDRFDALLKTETREHDWQSFFNDNPFIFSETLSIRFDALYRQVPLVTGVPDYTFCRNTEGGVTGDYGVIELKRPDQSIIGVYSSKVIAPSASVRVAQQQAKLNLDAIQRGQFLNTDDFFVAGNRRHAFIIIGTSSEITRKCQEDFILAQFHDLLPSGFHLYTYDEVFHLLRSTLPPVVQVLFVSSSVEVSKESQELAFLRTELKRLQAEKTELYSHPAYYTTSEYWSSDDDERCRVDDEIRAVESKLAIHEKAE